MDVKLILLQNIFCPPHLIDDSRLQQRLFEYQAPGNVQQLEPI